MRKIGIEEILNATCDELYITPDNNRQITYALFSRAMLSSDLFTTESTIKTRWKQLLTMDRFIERRGIDTKGNVAITLDLYKVHRYIVLKGQTPCYTIDRERDRESASEESQ